MAGRPKSGDHTVDNRIEDAMFLVEHGVGLEEICERLSVSKSTLQQNLKRAGVPWPWPREEQ